MNLVTALGNKIYCRPSGARYLVGSTMAPMLKSGYPVHFVAMDVKKHKDDSGSSSLSAQMCKTCDNVGKILRSTL